MMNYAQENKCTMVETQDLSKRNTKRVTDGHNPDATQTILDLLKSLSDDAEADNTDNNEEQPIDS